jgi:hypothetical protein
VNGLSTTAARSIENLWDVEIRLGGLRRAEVLTEIGFADVQGTTVHVGVDSDRLDAHLATGPDDAYRDFAAVCDQYSFEHENALPSG